MGYMWYVGIERNYETNLRNILKRVIALLVCTLELQMLKMVTPLHAYRNKGYIGLRGYQ